MEKSPISMIIEPSLTELHRYTKNFGGGTCGPWSNGQEQLEYTIVSWYCLAQNNQHLHD